MKIMISKSKLCDTYFLNVYATYFANKANRWYLQNFLKSPQEFTNQG